MLLLYYYCTNVGYGGALHEPRSAMVRAVSMPASPSPRASRYRETGSRSGYGGTAHACGCLVGPYLEGSDTKLGPKGS